MFTFLFSQPLTCKFNFHIRSVVAEQDTSCPAWLCALVGFLCFVMLVPGVLDHTGYSIFLDEDAMLNS